MTEDEMVGWHHQLNGHEFEQAPRVRDGQGSLACCSPWGHKELDTTEQLNQTDSFPRAVKTKYHRLDNLTEMYFFTVLESGSLWSGLVSSRHLPLACRWPSSPSVLMWSSLCVCVS